jgi:hypothetical protein
MGGNRNMDELIKRELDGLEIEPSQLTFNKVHKAYMAQKAGEKSSSNFYWLYIACGIVIVALLGYLMTDTTNFTDKNKSIAATEKNNSQETKTSKTENSALNNSESFANNTSASAPSSQTEMVEAGQEENITSTDNSSNNSRANITASTRSEKGMEAATSNKKIASVSERDLELSSTTSNGNGFVSTSTTNESNMLNASRKTSKTSRSYKRSKRNTKKSVVDENHEGSTLETIEIPGLAGESNSANSNAKENATDKEQISNNEQVLQNAMVLSKSSEGKETVDYLEPKSGFNYYQEADKELKTPPPSDSIVRLDLFKDYYKKRISPYYFTFGSEIQLNAINQTASANENYSVKVDLPQFNDKSYNQVLAESIHSSTQYNFGGSFLLGFHYQNWGIESGIRFFGFDNTTYLKHLPNSFYKRQFEGLIYDSLGTAYDSLYTAVSVKYPFVINGDTVSATKYLNSYRFVAIPLRLNYTFRFMKSKLLLEPSLGAQFCLPMASTHLVYEKAYNFSYEKSKKQLSPFVQLDGSLKLQYQLSRSAGIYIRQGYSFGNQSLYAANYPVKLDFSNIYTGVGISVTLRKY